MDVTQVRMTRFPQEPKHNGLKYFAILLTFFILLAEAALIGVDHNLIIDIFPDDVFQGGTVKTALTTGIWQTVFFAATGLYQLIWVIYTMATLCKQGINGGYLYNSPPFLHTGLFFMYMLSIILTVVLLFAIGRWSLAISFVLMAFIVITLGICVFLSIRGVCKYGFDLYQAGLGDEIKLVRGMVQNGLAMFAAQSTWTMVIHLVAVLERFTLLSAETSAIVGLSIMTWIILAWITMDWCILERHLRYIFTPFFAFVFFPAGILFTHGQYAPWNVITIFTVCLLVLTSFALVIKVIVSATRITNLVDPILQDSTEKAVVTNSVLSVPRRRSYVPHVVSAGSSPVYSTPASMFSNHLERYYYNVKMVPGVRRWFDA